jgi:hypothetical protein
MIDDLLGSLLAALAPARVKPADPLEDPDPALTAFFAHLAEHASLYRSGRHLRSGRHRTCRTTFPQRSSPVHSSAWPPTGYSADARERRAR